MNARMIILALLAVGVAGGTMYLARQWMANERATALANAEARVQPTEVSATTVLVADRDLPAGSFVRARDLRWQAWPDDAVSSDYIERGEARRDSFEGAVVRVGLREGEPITTQRIVAAGDRGFLAAVLEPGMRAVSVPVDATSGIAGLIFPGDRVDVILTHGVREDVNGETVVRRASETVLRDMRVLAIDQSVDDQLDAPQLGDTATLEATPREVEVISVMLQLGTLSLSLRSLADDPAPQGFVGRIAESVSSIFGVDLAAIIDDRQTYTMDTDVSVLLGAPAHESPPPPEPIIIEVPAEAAPVEVAPEVQAAPEQVVVIVRGGMGRTTVQ